MLFDKRHMQYLAQRVRFPRGEFAPRRDEHDPVAAIRIMKCHVCPWEGLQCCLPRPHASLVQSGSCTSCQLPSQSTKATEWNNIVTLRMCCLNFNFLHILNVTLNEYLQKEQHWWVPNATMCCMQCAGTLRMCFKNVTFHTQPGAVRFLHHLSTALAIFPSFIPTRDII